MSKKRKTWSQEEIDSLRDDYGILNPKELENKYCIDYDYIRRFCSKQGIKSKKNRVVRMWTPEEIIQFSNDWKENILTMEELEIKYKRNKNSLCCKAQELKIKRTTNVAKLCAKDIIDICTNYKNGINSYTLSKQYNVSQSSILTILRNNSIDIRDISHCKRSYKVNENYFDRIDDEHKAYWLGFLYADGYNQEERNCITLTLQERDKYILEELLKDLNSNYPIRSTHNKKFNKIYYSIRLSNQNLSRQLKLNGLVQNKTFISKFPILDKSLERHFIRGLFDGDGCISLSMRGKNKDRMYASFQIVNGNLEFLKNVNDSLNIDTNKYLVKYKNIYVLSFSKHIDIKSIYDFLYNDATVYLKRKKDKFEKYFLYKEENNHYEKNFRAN